MKKTLPVFLLFVIIVLEGYVVLSSELLAIRQTIPFVGSGTDTVSIIIAAVLMPLAFGYQAGGRYRPGFAANGRYHSIRRKLIRNMFISMIILLLGLSYALINVFFFALIKAGITHRLLLVTLYSAIFLVTPVYLLGQTIPLVSNYFSKQKLAKVTGKILFFSTLGSFLGAVFSTLVLMANLGVHHTVSLNFIILAGLIILLSKKKFSEVVIFAIFLAGAGLYLNSEKMMETFNIVENNQYNTIVVYEEDGERHLIMNNNGSSMYSDDGHKHDYVEFIEKIAITPILNTEEPKDILVIGAGAFTLGFEDTVNNYDFIDIDKSLKRISEEHILKAELTDNKVFHPVPARAFLTQSQKAYDLIVLDAYLGDLTLPEHLITVEFFKHVKAHLKPGGSMVGNFIASPNMANRFSRKLDNSLREAFPHINRYIVEEHDVWNTDGNKTANVIYSYTHFPQDDTEDVYTDNKNTVFYDKPQNRGDFDDKEPETVEEDTEEDENAEQTE
ncbi:MAG: fused MFS/spermidine synthase [Alphaproteobacteria bacterium]|nr:fused MFS/spermidine synthase [Alphaproteobacteria bacterium]